MSCIYLKRKKNIIVFTFSKESFMSVFNDPTYLESICLKATFTFATNFFLNQCTKLKNKATGPD